MNNCVTYLLTTQGRHACHAGLQVWDANLGQVACSFTFSDRVYGVAMSSAADTHCLVAVVGADPHVKLCDPATGGFTHSLVGHREPVWAASWSLTDQHHLLTGSCDGQVKCHCTMALSNHVAISICNSTMYTCVVLQPHCHSVVMSQLQKTMQCSVLDSRHCYCKT